MANVNQNANAQNNTSDSRIDLSDWKRRKKCHAPDPIFDDKFWVEQRMQPQSSFNEPEKCTWQVHISYPGAANNGRVILESSHCIVASGRQYFPIQGLKKSCVSETCDTSNSRIILPSQKRWR